MIKRLAALLLFLHFSVAYSQTIKTDVVVIGGTPSGVYAAMQCARSNVKTVQVIGGPSLSSNIGREFFAGVIPHVKQEAGSAVPSDSITKAKAAVVHKEIDNMLKNLTIDSNSKFISIKKDDDRWEVAINRGGKNETFKTRVVIDATNDGIVMTAAGTKIIPFDGRMSTQGLNNYRTSIAAGHSFPGWADDTTSPQHNYPPYPNYCVPIKALIATGANNIIVTEKFLHTSNDASYLQNGEALGQGAGVIAAYCAFFKTTTAHLNVRAIQVELLDYKGYLLHFGDITFDPYWRAIQQVCATGMLRGTQKILEGKQQFLFQPDSIVTTAEVKPVLTEIYTRAFLWFNMTKPGKEFTVGNLLSFISEITLTAPDNLQSKIEKEWPQYKIKSAFDMDRPITRREFAILANKYLNPFARAVDLDGRIVN